MRRSLIITLAIIGAIAVVCGGGGVVLVAWLGFSAGPPEGIVVDISRPDRVTVGESFELVVTVRNETDREREIQDIDFYEPLLNGVIVDGVVPPASAVDPSFGFATYTFNRSLSAGAEEVFTFSMTATTPGIYSGDLDVSIDSILSIATTAQTLVVEDADDPGG